MRKVKRRKADPVARWLRWLACGLVGFNLALVVCLVLHLTVWWAVVVAVDCLVLDFKVGK